ncbi:MAG: type II CRISPR RNA-guided endonuclease Cas9, partial [Bryobacterales bacterium]|nr:type II CRISPR RNA-guided endonuclease Cas9 [Bryobacterales bacterium]
MSNGMNGLVLGIDLGANSLGFALIDPANQRIVHTGVRIFEAGVNNLDQAKEETRNASRRAARLVRRQLDRRRRRYSNLFRLLQKNGLLPEGKRQEVLEKLDRELSSRFNEHGKLPYYLRARALDERLEPHEFGRAIYHLGQRRGFLSNRKFSASSEKADESGKVKSAIEGLWKEIHDAGCRTLGEYFYRAVDPHKERIRKRYTHRDMYSQEFDAIWNKQASFNPSILSDTLRQQIHNAIFYQRPLKDQSDKVGLCPLERGKRRAPMASLEVQRLRLMLALNNLRVFSEDGTTRQLSRDQVATLATLAEQNEKLTLAAARRQLKFSSGTRFSLEAGGEKNLPVNSTATRLRSVLGKTWDSLQHEERSRLVSLLIDAKGTEEALAKELTAEFGFDDGLALRVAATPLPSGYYSISLEAVRRILPLVEEGMDYTSAVNSIEEYREAMRQDPLPFLPAVAEALPEIRNPIVMRSLTELRKTVNALIREYGAIDTVRIELARDIRRGHEERMRLQKQNRDRETERARARAELVKYLNCAADDVKSRDIEKYLLWEECRHQCPYTGRPISMEALFGPAPLFQVEHIIPLSRSLDNSLNNKTLCANDANALKRNRTPWEAFGHDEAEWDRMTRAVKAFDNPAKFSRFVITEADQEAMLAEFTERQLNDTRYASKLAAKYLGLLFGGRDDAAGRRRVFTCAGQITALLRREWKLDGILSAKGHSKTRDDHRHHAVDAVTVAMSSPGIIKRLSDAAQRAGTDRRFQFGGYFAEPWVGFKEAVTESILNVNVSLRPEYKLLGQMHDETLYSRPWDGGGGKRYVTVRKPLDGGNFDIEDIVDPRIREIVRSKVEAAGTRKKLKDDPPLDAAGRAIRRVRVKVSVRTDPT